MNAHVGNCRRTGAATGSANTQSLAPHSNRGEMTMNAKSGKRAASLQITEHSKPNPAEAGNTKDTQRVPLMRYRKWFLAGVLVVGGLPSTTSPALASTFSAIDVPGATFTQTRRINDRGQIVGFYGAGGTNHGYLLEKGTFTA